MAGVVHVLCATLRPDVPPEVVDAAVERARGMSAAAGVRQTVCARTSDVILAATWVGDRAALEVFAASPEHMAFVMRGLAPCVRGMWSAASETEASPPGETEALWVFAVRNADAVFEWQIRDLLRSLEALPGTLAAGVTFEERDRYRAGGVVAVPPGRSDTFRTALDALRPSWGDLGEHVVEAFAPVPGA
ncbi:MAG: hypothetical protein AMXMBFR23_07590 [Chloroflexota bacterium]